MNIVPDLSICVATTSKRPEVLERFLSSVSQTDDHLSMEIIVVDRYSVAKSSLEVIRKFSTVNLVEIDAGCSLASAFGQAMSISNGRYVSLWSDDIIVGIDSLVRLVEFLDENPDAGVVAPRMKNEIGEILPVARALPSLRDVMGSKPVLGLPVSERNDQGSGESEWLLGPPMIINRCLFDEIGGISGQFPQYWHLEYCLRAARAGWHMLFCHDAQVKSSYDSFRCKNYISRLSLLQEKIAIAFMIVAQRLRA
jgi:N-acetylglucosaminyl-diphospho-decaprenol L-rhamnosyltransferase